MLRRIASAAALSRVSREKNSAADRLFCGTSGWAYSSWRPGFYPDKLSPRRFLRHYSSQLNTVEVNYTFSKLPTAAQTAQWLADTPEGFRFSFKAPRRITHFRRLLDCEQQLSDFLLAIQPFALAGRLGTVLFQLPPNLKADAGRLREFLSQPTLRQAPPLAFEFRHASWFAEEIYTLLADHGAALCIAETDDLQTPEVHTAPGHTSFRLRRHGGYSDRELDKLATHFLELSASREVYIALRHEDEPTGALNAVRLRELARQRQRVEQS